MLLLKSDIYERRTQRMGRKGNKEGSVRQLQDGSFECVIQSKYLNPKTAKPKRFKRKGETEEEAIFQAKKAMRVWEKEFESGKDIKIKKTRTFGSYMEEYIDTVVKKTITASGYHSYISNMKNNFYPFPISNLQLHMLSKVEFENYYNTILELKSKKTCSLPRQLCVRCCDWLIAKSLIDENFASQAEYKKEVVDEYNHKQEKRERERKKVFTSEDIQKFYYAYKNNMGEYPVVALFLLETGLRAGEFAALKLDNINLAENKIYIRETSALRFKDNDKEKGIEIYTKVPKNKEERFIVMSDLCRECVLFMIEQTKLKCKNNTDGLLYPTFRNGKMRSNSSMEVCFKELCDKLDVDRDVRLTKTGQKKGLCLHSLRHTMDSIANSASGANVVNTALMMGHRAVSVENVYTHATEEGLASVTTPSQAVLDDYRKKPKAEDIDDKELYEMYLRLKEKFE